MKSLFSYLISLSLLFSCIGAFGQESIRFYPQDLEKVADLSSKNLSEEAIVGPLWDCFVWTPSSSQIKDKKVGANVNFDSTWLRYPPAQDFQSARYDTLLFKAQLLVTYNDGSTEIVDHDLSMTNVNPEDKPIYDSDYGYYRSNSTSNSDARLAPVLLKQDSNVKVKICNLDYGVTLRINHIDLLLSN